MATKTQSLAHTKWLCKYHIVFTPKYRRKVIYNQYRNSLREILRRLCEYKGVKIIEGELMADHVHMYHRLQRGRDRACDERLGGPGGTGCRQSG